MFDFQNCSAFKKFSLPQTFQENERVWNKTGEKGLLFLLLFFPFLLSSFSLNFFPFNPYETIFFSQIIMIMYHGIKKTSSLEPIELSNHE